MRPLTIINLLLLGTAVSISLSLSVVALLFVLLAPKYPQMGAEIGTLFMTDFILPFEVASVFLVIALIGAAMIVRRRTR